MKEKEKKDIDQEEKERTTAILNYIIKKINQTTS